MSIIGTNPLSLGQIEAELTELQAELELLGGRDVELAETIDRLSALVDSYGPRHRRDVPSLWNWSAILNPNTSY